VTYLNRGNNFTPGPIPSCLSSLVKLEALFMSNCHLKGPFPEWIGDLSELRQLDLQRNNLRGTLPNSIGKLGNMLYLNLKDNVELYGPLPVQQLSRLTRLNRLSLVHCRFTVTDEVVNELQSHLPRCRLWL
jgi:Leucine-rich repeat (LRR) protein